MIVAFMICVKQGSHSRPPHCSTQNLVLNGGASTYKCEEPSLALAYHNLLKISLTCRKRSTYSFHRCRQGRQGRCDVGEGDGIVIENQGTGKEGIEGEDRAEEMVEGQGQCKRDEVEVEVVVTSHTCNELSQALQTHHQMLTLNKTTHFFWNLSNNTHVRRASVTSQTPVVNWVNATVPGVPPPPVLQCSTSTLPSRASSQTCTVRMISTHSFRFQSSWSALSAQVSVKGYARVGQNNKDEDSFVGGLFNHDELEGDEFKDAQNSPVKGKCCVDSKVGLYVNSY